MSKRWSHIVFLSVLCPIFIAAQYKVSGTVTDATTGSPLSEIEVFDNVSGTVVSTDDNGNYSFEFSDKGLHEFTFFGLSYGTVSEVIDVGNQSILDVKLDRLSFDMSAIEVAAKREEIFAIKQLKDVEGTAIYAGKKTEVVVLDLVTGNLASNKSRQIYAQVSGLNIYDGNEGGLQLAIGGRGLDPNRTSNFNTRQNGYDISADVLGYPENYYSPPSEALSQINIVRGASSLQYGSQFGGLINFKLKEIPSFRKFEIETNQTYGSNNFFGSFNRLGYNNDGFKLNIIYNHKEGDGYRDYSQFNSNNVILTWSQALGKKTKITSEFTYLKYLAKQAGGLTDEQFESTPRLSTRTRNWFEVDWKLYNVKLEHSFNESSDLSINFFGLDAQRNSVGFRGNPINLNENPITALDEQDVDGEFILPRDLIKGQFRNYGAEVRFINRYKLKNRKSVILLGSKYYKSDNTSFQGPGSTFSDADFTDRTEEFPDYASQSDFEFPNLNLAFFGENIFYASDKLSITPGFRIEHISTKASGVYKQVIFDNAGNPIANNLLEEDRNLKRSFALLGIGVNYKKNDQLILNANISQNYRSVTFSDIRVVSPSFIVDPDIADESGFTADVGLRGRYKKAISYDIGVYGILYNDRIGVILDDRANRVRKNIGKAIIGGFESLIDLNFVELLNWDKSNFRCRWFANTALTFSEYLESEENNVVGKKVEFIPTINLKSGLSLGYKNLLSTIQFSYLSEQFTDVQNSLAAVDGDKRSGIIGEIPSYQIFDFTLSYQFKHFKLSGGLNNLFDESYFTQRATGYPGPGIIPSSGRTFFITLSYNYGM